MIENIIDIKNLSKDFYINDNKVNILNNIDFKVTKGDIISIIGPSGSGKSTLLNILGLLDSEYKGNYSLLQKNVNHLNINDKNVIRNKSIGFVHQFFHLIPELTIIENVALPSLINNKNNSYTIANKILIKFGLEGRINSRPNNLSGGEQQRAAIARALINQPDIVLADEMTGNLDEKTANSVFEFFLETIKINEQSLIFVTHNKYYAERANKVYEISNQKLKLIK